MGLMSLGLIWDSWQQEEGLPSATRPRQRQVIVKPHEGAEEMGSHGSPAGTGRPGPPQGRSMLGSAAELWSCICSVPAVTCRFWWFCVSVSFHFSPTSATFPLHHSFGVFGVSTSSQFQLPGNCSLEWPIGTLAVWLPSASPVLCLSYLTHL